MYICIIYIERLVLYNYVYSLMQVNLNFMCGLGLGGGSSLDTRGISWSKSTLSYGGWGGSRLWTRK